MFDKSNIILLNSGKQSKARKEFARCSANPSLSVLFSFDRLVLRQREGLF